MPIFAEVAEWMAKGIANKQASFPANTVRKVTLRQIARDLAKKAPGHGISAASLSAYCNGATVPNAAPAKLLAEYFFSDKIRRKEFCAAIGRDHELSDGSPDPWRALLHGNAVISVGIVSSGPLAVAPSGALSVSPRRTEGFFDFLLNRMAVYSALPIEVKSADIVSAVERTGRSLHLACPLLECPDRTKTLRFFPTPVRVSVAAVTSFPAAHGGFPERTAQALRALTNSSTIDLSDGDLVVAGVEIGGLFVLQAMRGFTASGANIVKVKQGARDEYVRYLTRGKPTVAILDEYSAVALLKKLPAGSRMLLDPWDSEWRAGQRRLPSYPLGFATGRFHDQWSDYFAHALERSLEAEMDVVAWAYARLWAELVLELSEVVPNDYPGPPPRWAYPEVIRGSRTTDQLARAEDWADRVVGFTRPPPESARYVAAALWREVLQIASQQRQIALDELAASLGGSVA